MRFFASILLGVVTVMAAQLGFAGENSNAPASQPIKVLFIGNSLTMNNNLPYELATIAAATTPPVKIETAMVATGGYTLEKHWKTEKALKKIQEGGWDFVVLQEHTYCSKADPNSTDANKNFDPVNKADLTKEFARKFDEEIKKIKARGVIYQNWALQKTPDDQPAINKIYDDISKELGSLIVPVAQARLNAVKADPSLNFFVKDGKHPTQAGTYLAACTFFKALTGKSPKNSVMKIVDPKDPKKVLCDLTAEQAAFLQKIADEVVR